ncbi:MAG: Xaa-Pro peptidase family protein [Lachnospiraceae bacterium]|nr:Xaa-Pro peptidase family protein [Lachnospiraceae bacterium]
MNKQRMERVIALMKERGLSQIVITNPHSINYLAGHLEEPFERFWALYLSETNGPCLIANRLFTLDDVENIPIRWYEDGEDAAAVLAGVTDPGSVLGVDEALKANILLRLMELNAAAGYVVASACVDEVRYQKDEEELELMRRSSQINDAAMEQFVKLIKKGVTEKQVAEQMLAIYRSLGAEGFSFEPLVAFGPNAAGGHHGPDDTVLKEGDCVLFDVGCKYKGYCSDMTRTFFYGFVRDEDRKVYETVLKAQLAAEEKVAPGVVLKTLDQTARDIIAAEGMGENFTHRLGHFIGVEEHEKGDVSPVSEIVAKEGMVFSIEPGAYLPGQVGVRIEDLVAVTKDGVEILNHYPKELQIIPAE